VLLSHVLMCVLPGNVSGKHLIRSPTDALRA
jgi:hypothetical protein